MSTEEKGVLSRAWKVIKKVINDCFTSANGDYDPARIAGYGIVVLGSFLYLVFTAYTVFTTGVFNPVEYTTSLAGISASLMGAAAGVWIKKSTEVPVDQTKTE